MITSPFVMVLNAPSGILIAIETACRNLSIFPDRGIRQDDLRLACGFLALNEERRLRSKSQQIP